MPAITANLTDTITNAGTSVTLNALATVADGGMVTYAWYSNTKRSTDGATSLSVATAAYSPDVSAAGTTYYYCVVTNTNRFEGLFMFGE